MTTYIITNTNEKNTHPLMEHRKKSSNLKSNSKIKKTSSLNNSYMIFNHTEEIKKTSLSSSQSS